MTSSRRVARGADTAERLVDAAAAIVCDAGAAALSVQRIADAAGTSKALVHYHFAAKDSILVACARVLARRVLAHEAGVLDHATTASAMSDLWHGVMSPEVVASRRALVSLSTDAAVATHDALVESRRARVAAAVDTMAALERLFGFGVSVPREALGDALVAFLDGLSVVSNADVAAQRAAFDAFWLAVLSLDH